MRRVISILIVLGLLLGMILAVTACPKSENPGAGGTVTSHPTLPPLQPNESTVPKDATDQPTAPPAGGPAAPGGEAGGGAAAPPTPAPPTPTPPPPAPGG